MFETPDILLDAPTLRRYGYPQYVQAASPAVASNFTQTLGGNFHTRLVCVFCRMVADANVANREVVLEYRDDQAQRYALHGSAVFQTAGQTRDYCFGSFQPGVVQPVDSSQLIPLTPVLLPPTHDWRIVIVTAQAGDQLSRIRFVWEQFYTTGSPPGP